VGDRKVHGRPFIRTLFRLAMALRRFPLLSVPKLPLDPLPVAQFFTQILQVFHFTFPGSVLPPGIH